MAAIGARHYRLSIGSTSSLVDKYEGQDWTLGHHTRRTPRNSAGGSPNAASEQCLSGCISPLPEDEPLFGTTEDKPADCSFACSPGTAQVPADEGYVPGHTRAFLGLSPVAGEIAQRRAPAAASGGSVETPRAKPIHSRSEGLLLGPIGLSPALSPSHSISSAKPPLPVGPTTPTNDVHAFTPTPLRTVGRSYWVKQGDSHKSLTPLAVGKSASATLPVAATPPPPTTATPVRLDGTVVRSASPMPQRMQRSESVIRARSPSTASAVFTVPKGKTLRYIGTSVSPTATVVRSRKTATGDVNWQHTSRPHTHSGTAGAGTPRFPTGGSGSFTAVPMQGVTSLGGGSTRSLSTMRSHSPGAPPPAQAISTTGGMNLRSTSASCLVWAPPEWPEGTSPRAFVSPRFGAGKSLPSAPIPSWCPSSTPTVCVATPIRNSNDE